MGCILKPIISIIKWALMIIGLITVILAIIIGVAFWQLTQTPGLKGEMHEVVATDQGVTKFDGAITDFEEDLGKVAVGILETATLRLDEQWVTSKMVEAIEEADIPLDVHDVWVNFTDGEIQILGQVDVGRTLTAGVVLEMGIDAATGEPELTVGELAVGKGWLIPGAAKDAIANLIPTEEALTDMVTDAMGDLDVKLTSIQVEDGDLVFTAGPK